MSYYYAASETKIKFSAQEYFSVEISEGFAPNNFAELKVNGDIVVHLCCGVDTTHELMKFKDRIGNLSIYNLGTEFVPQHNYIHKADLFYELAEVSWEIGLEYPICKFVFKPQKEGYTINKNGEENISVDTCCSGEYCFTKN